MYVFKICNVEYISFKLFVKYEEFEDTKGVIRIHKLKKYRQHNGQMKKY